METNAASLRCHEVLFIWKDNDKHPELPCYHYWCIAWDEELKANSLSSADYKALRFSCAPMVIHVFILTVIYSQFTICNTHPFFLLTTCIIECKRRWLGTDLFKWLSWFDMNREISCNWVKVIGCISPTPYSLFCKFLIVVMFIHIFVFFFVILWSTQQQWSLQCKWIMASMWGDLSNLKSAI